MRLSEVSSTHTPPRALSRHGTFWWLLQVALFAVLGVVAHETVDATSLGLDPNAPCVPFFATGVDVADAVPSGAPHPFSD